MTRENQPHIAVGFVLAHDALPPQNLVQTISTGLATYFSAFRWTLIHAHTVSAATQTPAEIPGLDNQIVVAVPWAGIQHVTYPWHGLPAKTASYRALLAEAERIGAAMCLIVDPSEHAFEADWVDSLIRPGLHSRYDFVTPSHPEKAGQQPISTNLLSPLLEGLFGGAPVQPLSGTFLVSSKLIRRLLSRPDWDSSPARYVPELWMNFVAAAEGYRRAEAFAGQSRRTFSASILPAHSVVAQIVESTFSLMEQYESRWLGAKGGGPLDQFGPMDRSRMSAPAAREDGWEYLVQFANSHEALQDQWRAIFDPHTYREIATFHRSLLDGDTEARLTDAAWVRIVYELAGARKRHIYPRSQLVGLFVPLYWACLGSQLMKVRWADQGAAARQSTVLRNYFKALKPVLDRLWTGSAARSEAA